MDFLCTSFIKTLLLFVMILEVILSKKLFEVKNKKLGN